MSDEEIRRILIERKRQARKAERREEIKELVGDALAWICWVGLGYMAFLGAYMIGG